MLSFTPKPSPQPTAPHPTPPYLSPPQLEYTVRRILPIPKKYFWERKNPTDPNEADHTETLSFRTKLWHRSVAVLGKALYVAEYAGEIIAQVSFAGR